MFYVDNKPIHSLNKISNHRNSSTFINFFAPKKQNPKNLIEKISSRFISQFEKVLKSILFELNVIN